MPFRTVTVSPKMIPAQAVGLQAALMGPLKMTKVSQFGIFLFVFRTTCGRRKQTQSSMQSVVWGLYWKALKQIKI